MPSLGDLPNPGIKPRSPALQVAFLPAEPQGKLKQNVAWNYKDKTVVDTFFFFNLSNGLKEEESRQKKHVLEKKNEDRLQMSKTNNI